MWLRCGIHVLPVLAGLLVLGGCSSSPTKQVKLFSAGEKIPVARLSYAVVDVQINPVLPGPDPANPRTPQHRFYTVQISVSNGGNEDTPIPGLALVNDAGEVFNELPDGGGVARWLGPVRRVGPGQTEEGAVLFDAPTAHYKLRLTDEFEDEQVFADLPLNFVHEVVNAQSAVSSGLEAAQTAPTPDATPTNAAPPAATPPKAATPKK